LYRENHELKFGLGMIMGTKNIVMIGASTGGFTSVERLFSKSSPLNASVIIVQHMLESVNLPFRNHLCGITDMEVKIAEDGDILEAGKVYIAPSGLHLKVVSNRRIGLFNDAKVNFVRPSIDVSMKSLKNIPGSKIVGVILTGMGKDGAAGIRHIKRIGGITMVQDGNSSPVSGMSEAAAETGDIDLILAPDEMREKLIEEVGTINDEIARFKSLIDAL